jgi:cytochrome c oxidase subunit 1
MFPLITGRMYNEKLGKIHFVAAFTGVIIVFMTQHVLGLMGMPRRYFDYIPLPEWIAMNQIATTGAWIVGLSYLLMIYNLLKSAMTGVAAKMNDPFNIGEQYYDYRRRDPHH